MLKKSIIKNSFILKLFLVRFYYVQKWAKQIHVNTMSYRLEEFGTANRIFEVDITFSGI